MAKLTPMSEVELHSTLLNLAILLMLHPDAKIMPRQIRLLESHIRTCAACAALMQPTGGSPANAGPLPSQVVSTVVNIQEWLQRRSRGTLTK